jgi:hypothetical protein
MKGRKIWCLVAIAVVILFFGIHPCPCADILSADHLYPAFTSFFTAAKNPAAERAAGLVFINPQEPSPTAQDMGKWAQKILLSGMLAGEFRWQRTAPAVSSAPVVTTDLYLRMLDLAFESSFADWLEATAVLISEYIGDDLNPGDEKITLDEVHVDIRIPQTPIYFVLGKRTQAFGLFENYLVTDPLTQDAYETKKVGFTGGLKGPLDFDVSLSVYKGDEQMSHLFESGLFDAETIQRDSVSSLKTDSLILAASFSPVKDSLTLFGACLSEPGSSKRNRTVTLGFSFVLPSFQGLIWEGEYMKALSRELYAASSRAYKEGALSLTAAYRFVIRKRKHKGSTYRARKSQIRAHPIEIAARYEFFDDDSLATDRQVWTTRSRWSVGGRYTLFESGSTFFYVMGEYRNSRFRVPSALRETRPESQDEIYLRLGVDF